MLIGFCNSNSTVGVEKTTPVTTLVTTVLDHVRLTTGGDAQRTGGHEKFFKYNCGSCCASGDVCQVDTGDAPFDAGDGADRVVKKEGKYDAISGGKDNDTIIIRDGAKPSEVLGGADNDRIVLKDGAKAVTIDGEDGRNTIVLRGGKSDKVKGGKGRDTITLKDGKVGTVDAGGYSASPGRAAGVLRSGMASCSL